MTNPIKYVQNKVLGFIAWHTLRVGFTYMELLEKKCQKH
jgi:hypothetical protein